MDITSSKLVSVVLSAIVTLFPLINPFGTAIALNPVFSKLDDKDMRSAALKISVYGFFIMFISMLIGNYILQIFGVDISIVQFAGGVLIVYTGWKFLNDSSNGEGTDVSINAEGVEKQLFYPLTFPVTVGAGSIAGILSLSAQNLKDGYIFNDFEIIIALTIGIVINCLILFLVYASSTKLTSRLKDSSKLIANKLSAFLVFCVGFQVLYSATIKLFPSLIR